jgi:hypothetical protein
MRAQGVAALVQRHRFLQADIAAFEAADDGFEFAHRGFEGQRRNIGGGGGIGGIRHPPALAREGRCGQA